MSGNRTSSVMQRKLMMLIACLLIALIELSANSSSALAKEKTILVLHSYHKGLSWTDNLQTAIVDGLKVVPDLTVYTEYLDTKRHPDASHLNIVKRYLVEKYKDIPIDLLVICDDNALSFVLANRKRLFANLPIVFTGISNFTDELVSDHAKITGVVDKTAAYETLTLALKLRPATGNIYVIHDQTTTGLAERQKLERELKQHPLNKPVQFITNMSTKELLAKVGTIPKTDLVLLILWNRDADGVYFDYEESAELITAATPALTYGLWDFYLGHGVLGGDMVSAFSHGEAAAEMVRRFYEEGTLKDIPIQKKGPNQILFDVSMLHRAGIAISELPIGSRLWENNKIVFRVKESKEVRIGVLARRGIDQCLEAWRPTGDYLTRKNSRLSVCDPMPRFQ